MSTKMPFRALMFLLLVRLIRLTCSSPLNTRASIADACTTVPSWTVSSFHSTTSDSTGSGGSATFKLTNDLTGASDNLTCTLQVNYRCIITGTPTDSNLTVNMAIRAQALTLLLDEVVQGCPGRTSPLHIIGDGDLQLDCSWDQDIGGTVTCQLKGGNDTIQGKVVELAPGS